MMVNDGYCWLSMIIDGYLCLFMVLDGSLMDIYGLDRG